jgi:hypothetical protein
MAGADATYAWVCSLGSGSSNHVTMVRKCVGVEQYDVSLVRRRRPLVSRIARSLPAIDIVVPRHFDAVS